LVVSAPGDNTTSLAWNPVPGGEISHAVHRASGSCPATDWRKIADGVVGTGFGDNGLSGGFNYACRLAASSREGCVSEASSCDDATATGLCTRVPDFTGVEAVFNQQGSDCAVELIWRPAMLHCGGTARFNVYRSSTPYLEPGPDNLIADRVSETSSLDFDTTSGSRHYYTVRAEDDSGNGGGPCSGGNEDTNSLEVLGVATGPATAVLNDDIEDGSSTWVGYAGPFDAGGATCRRSGLGLRKWLVETGRCRSCRLQWRVCSFPLALFREPRHAGTRLVSGRRYHQRRYGEHNLEADLRRRLRVGRHRPVASDGRVTKNTPVAESINRHRFADSPRGIDCGD
jgi:hypothetical protein